MFGLNKRSKSSGKMTKANHSSTKEIEKNEPKLILETRSTIEITIEIQN